MAPYWPINMGLISANNAHFNGLITSEAGVITPMNCMANCGLRLFLLPGSAISNIFCPIFSLILEHA